MTTQEFFESQATFLVQEAQYLESTAAVFTELAKQTRQKLEELIAFKDAQDALENVDAPPPLEPEYVQPTEPKTPKKSLEDFTTTYPHSQVLPLEATTDKQRKTIYAAGTKLFPQLKGEMLRARILLAISNILGTRVNHISKLHTNEATQVVDSFVKSCKDRGLWDESR